MTPQPTPTPEPLSNAEISQIIYELNTGVEPYCTAAQLRRLIAEVEQGRMRSGTQMKLTNPPDRIWLQFYGDEKPVEGEAIEITEDVTWCQDKIHKYDVEYVRVRRKRRRAEKGEEE